MNRTLRVFGVFGLTVAVILGVWLARNRSARNAVQPDLAGALQSAITNSEQFARNHFTGGVGAILVVNPDKGALEIANVLPGSPAQQAGLKSGDQILQINAVSTSGRSLAQNLEAMRGFVGGAVTLVIQREGSTNFECVLRRSSWNSLGVPQ